MSAIPGILVDSSVLLDIVTDDPHWCAWSSEALATWAERVPLYINVVIYAEISIGFARRLLLDSRVVDLPIAYNPTFVFLPPSSPYFSMALKMSSASRTMLEHKPPESNKSDW